MATVSYVPHLNIYVDEPAARRIVKAAKSESLSLSRWAREKLLAAAGTPDWPVGYSDVLGSVQEESFIAPQDPPPEEDPMARFE